MSFRWRLLRFFLPLILFPILFLSLINAFTSYNLIISNEYKSIEYLATSIDKQVEEDYETLKTLGLEKIPFYQERLINNVLNSPSLSIDSGLFLSFLDSLGNTLVTSDGLSGHRDGGTKDRIEVYHDVPGTPWTLHLFKLRSDVLFPLTRNNIVSVFFMLCTMIISIVLGLLFSHRFTKPIVDLSITMERFGYGELGVRARENLMGEIGSLAIQFNKMAQTIETSTEALEAQVKIRSKELYASLEELRNTQDQLVEQEKLAGLGSMVAGFAHELNTPLGVVITASTYIQNELKELDRIIKNEIPITRKSLMERIENLLSGIDIVYSSTQKSSDLVNQFKMVAVNQHIDQLEELKMSIFLQSLRDTLKVILSPKKIELVIVSNNCHPIQSYPSIMWQVITNLCKNSEIHAFNETSGDSRLTISCQGRDDGLTIRVEDNGIGIPDDLRKKIFEPFFTTKRGKGSTGLGLNIVYNLVHQKLGGTIHVEGAKEGSGAVFVIELPNKP